MIMTFKLFPVDIHFIILFTIGENIWVGTKEVELYMYFIYELFAVCYTKL